MAFTEADRVQIRQYVGWTAIFKQAQPLLESAITTIQAAPDGQAVDNSTELLVKSYLAQLQAIDAKLFDLGCLGVNQVGNIQQDNIRARMVVMQWGRVLVGRLCTVLSLEGPISDCYSAGTTGAPRPGYQIGLAG